jgi:hypothetical protein
MKTFIKLPVLAAFAFFLSQVETPAQPKITRFTIDGGGGTSQGGSSSISGTIGQPDAGRLSGGDYQIRGGFWIGAGGGAPATETPTSTNIPATPTSTPTPTPTSVSSTPTNTPTAKPAPSGLDVKPEVLDQYIDALDLVEWLERNKATPPQGSPDILLEFALYWQGEYPPAVISQNPNE